MPFPIFPFLLRRKPQPKGKIPLRPVRTPRISPKAAKVRRYFFNARGFQTYASFFAHWDGWITAGHCLDECGLQKPPFADGNTLKWPGGLDAALIGCTLPEDCPPDPAPGQSLICTGYPAGSAHAARRKAEVYLQRPGAAGTWIAHIREPDEPVVTGMSGGLVADARSGAPVGIIITRNSPADLNNDRDPDESLDFIALSAIWRAVKDPPLSV